MTDKDVVGETLQRAGFPPEVAFNASVQRAQNVLVAPLIDALQALLRCPGIDQTDQEQGATFRTIAEVALERAGVKVEEKIDTRNLFLIGAQGDRIVLLRPPTNLTHAEAINAAAYLVALSERSFEEFQRVYEAVCNT